MYPHFVSEMCSYVDKKLNFVPFHILGYFASSIVIGNTEAFIASRIYNSSERELVPPWAIHTGVTKLRAIEHFHTYMRPLDGT